MGATAKPSVIVGVGALIAATIHPVAGIAAAVAGFGKIDLFMKLAAKYLLKNPLGGADK